MAPAARRRSARSERSGACASGRSRRPLTSPAPARAAPRSPKRSAGFARCGIERFVALRGDPPGGLSEPYRPHPSGFRDTAELVAALKRARRRRGLRLRLSRAASAEPRLGDRDRRLEAQGRCRRRPRHHPVLLRQRSLRGLSSSACAAPASRFRSCPGSCRSTASSRCAISPSRCGAAMPDRLARRFDGLESGSGDARSRRRRGRHRADGRPRRPRRRRISHLHVEPRRADGSGVPRAWTGSRRGCCRLRRLTRRAQRTPKTIAPRKIKAAQTATIFRGLMKVIGWPPSASCGA